MKSSCYEAVNGSEYFSSFESSVELSFVQSAEDVFQQYTQYQENLELNDQSAIILIFYFSDIANQLEEFKLIAKTYIENVFCFFLGQEPASGCKLAMQAYHIDLPKTCRNIKVNQRGQRFEHGDYTTEYTAFLPESLSNIASDSKTQTKAIFSNLEANLNGSKLTLIDNVIRTWIYARDIDNNYAGLVDVRTEIFQHHGMTKDTHYIASTGIEAKSEKTNQIVFMYVLSIKGLEQEQITFMSAPEHLNPTYEYGVTFERATSITFGDRAHYYISGTASIDHLGNVLYPGNIKRQTERALINIKALLTGYNASLEDLKSVIVYLRDPSDYKTVRTIVDKFLPENLSIVFVKGAVCRPSWLVEIEGIAVNSHSDSRFPNFI